MNYGIDFNSRNGAGVALPEVCSTCSFFNFNYFVKNWYLTNVMSSSDIMNKSLAKGNSSICLLRLGYY